MSSDDLFGWRTATWVSVLGGLCGLAMFILLVFGPQPWRATKWAWFWLLQSPVGVLVVLGFALTAGPTARIRAPRDPDHRLTGGWAFLIGMLVPILLPPSWR